MLLYWESVNWIKLHLYSYLVVAVSLTAVTRHDSELTDRLTGDCSWLRYSQFLLQLSLVEVVLLYPSDAIQMTRKWVWLIGTYLFANGYWLAQWFQYSPCWKPPQPQNVGAMTKLESLHDCWRHHNLKGSWGQARGSPQSVISNPLTWLHMY